MKLFVVALLAASSASALRLAGRDTSLDKGTGKIVHVKFDQNTDSVSIFGFELSDTRSGIEIASADEWKPLMFSICEKSDGCHEVTIPNSKTRPDKTRKGVQMSKQAFGKILPKLLEQVHVDIFHTSDLSKWSPAEDVYDFGPVAPLEMGRILSGETKLFTSTLMTYLSSGNTILALTTGMEEDATEKVASLRRSIEKALLEHSQKPPLLYYIGYAGSHPEFMKDSMFPKECFMISTDYWTNNPNTIHAIPDGQHWWPEPDKAALIQLQTKVPIMTTTCHANDEPSLGGSDYILMYAKRQKISDEWLVDMQQEMKLPVVVLDKSLYSTEFSGKLADGITEACPEALTKGGVKCIAPVNDPVKFHTILKGARLVIYEGVNEDAPSMIEATQCGTPVLIQHNSHEFLENEGEQPHVWIWGNSKPEELKNELFGRIHATIEATAEGNHKLPSWRPKALEDVAMQKGLNDLMLNTRNVCDAAMQHHS